MFVVYCGGASQPDLLALYTVKPAYAAATRFPNRAHFHKSPTGSGKL